VKKHEHAASTSVKRGVYNSQPFVNVVKGVSNGEKMDSECTPVDDSPTVIVSQDDDNELELALIGCHKDFRSIANSKTICRNEGFTGVEVKYLGGLWVMFVFNDKQVKDSFLKHEGIVSWFSSLEPWHDDFVLKERLVWLEIEGVPIRSWNNDTFKSICKKWGKGERICRWTLTFAPEVAENEEEGSVDKSSNAKNNNDKEDKVESMGEFFDNNGNETHFNKDEENMVAKDIVHQPTNSDPFELESLIAKNGNYQKQGSSIPKFPPGFTQSDGSDIKRDLSDVCKPVAREDRDETSVHYESKSIQPEDEVTKKHVGVSMIQQVEDTIKVSTALGFNMEGCQDMLAKMIADMGDKVETKMLHVDLWTLRQVWGNSQFDFVSTSARGRSGGILYIWNKLLFHKERIISVDSYVAVQGTWLQNGLKIMFVVVYAPQDLASKIILWSTLSQLISNWDGNAIIMGNFNEVQEVGDRFGTVFNEKKIENDRKEASDIAQKAMVKWAIEGDENTSFFHKDLKSRGSIVSFREMITSQLQGKLRLYDRREDDTSTIQGKLRLYDEVRARTLFVLSSSNRGRLLGIIDLMRQKNKRMKQEGLNRQIRKLQDRDVSNEEIKKAVWDCGGDRAPGLDGFTFKFLKLFRRASILVNGSPTSEFELSKGLHQGDPMSPFLFILAMEGLHAMVSKAVNMGLFKGASIGHSSINVSHLLYADDAIFVGEWSYSNAYNLICLLWCFYMVSGLKINVHKSKLLVVNVPDEEVSNMALVLGCGIAKLPMMYLGVPVRCNMGRCD
ncbi:RNA-directed DNA polymerase, eukaryota, partial [Tanacetum coccineum]